MSAVDPNNPVIVIPGGGGASIPAAPADVLLDVGNPSTLTGLDSGGIGTSYTPAAARQLLGLATDPWLPSSGLLALLRASSLSLSDGDPVSTWAPSVGTPGSLTGSGSARPTYRATGSPSGGPAVEFDGASDYLSLSSPSGLPTGASAGTIVAILSRMAGGAGLRHVVMYGSVTNNSSRGLATSNGAWATHEWATPMVSGSDAPRTLAGHVLGHLYDGSAVPLWVDGVPAVARTVALATVAPAIIVGSRIVPAAELAAFRLMELAIYSTALTDAQWAQVMAHARIAHGVP